MGIPWRANASRPIMGPCRSVLKGIMFGVRHCHREFVKIPSSCKSRWRETHGTNSIRVTRCGSVDVLRQVPDGAFVA